MPKKSASTEKFIIDENILGQVEGILERGGITETKHELMGLKGLDFDTAKEKAGFEIAHVLEGIFDSLAEVLPEILLRRIKSLELLVKIAPSFQKLRTLASLHARSENGAVAVSLYEEILEMPISVVEKRDILFSLSELYFEYGKSEKALHCCEELIRMQPFKKESYILRAKIYLQSGNYDAAMQTIKKVLNLDAGAVVLDDDAQENCEVEADVWYTYGEILFKKGDLKKAQFAFATAIHFQPDHAEALDFYEWVSARIKKEDREKKEVDEIQEGQSAEVGGPSADEGPLVHFKQFDHLGPPDKTQFAASNEKLNFFVFGEFMVDFHFVEAIKSQNPNLSSALLKELEGFVGEDFDIAVDKCSDNLRMLLDQFFGNVFDACSLDDQKLILDVRIRRLKSMLGEKVTANRLLMLAKCYLASENFAEAITVYQQIEKMDLGKDLREFVLFQIFNCYKKAGLKKEALVSLDKLMATNPDSSKVWFYYAEVLLRDNQYRKAKLACEKGLALDSDNVDAHEKYQSIMKGIDELSSVCKDSHEDIADVLEAGRGLGVVVDDFGSQDHASGEFEGKKIGWLLTANPNDAALLLRYAQLLKGGAGLKN